MYKVNKSIVLIVVGLLFFNSFALARRVHNSAEEASAFLDKIIENNPMVSSKPEFYPSEFQAYRPFLEAVLYGVHNEFKQWINDNIVTFYRRDESHAIFRVIREYCTDTIDQLMREGAIFEIEFTSGYEHYESRERWMKENIISKGYVAISGSLEDSRKPFFVAPVQLIEEVRAKFKEIYDKHLDIYLRSTGSVLPENDTYAFINFLTFYPTKVEFWDGDKISRCLASLAKNNPVFWDNDPRREFIDKWEFFVHSYSFKRTITAEEFCEGLIDFFHSPLAKDLRGMDGSGTMILGRSQHLECSLSYMLIPGWDMYSFPTQDITLILDTIASLAREDEQLADYFCGASKGFPVNNAWYENSWLPMAMTSMQQDTEKALDALMTVLRRHEESGLDSMRRGFSTTANKFMHWEFVFLEICAEAIAMLRPKNETEKEMILSALEEIAEMDYLDPASRIARHVLDNREIVISAEPRRAEDYQVLLKYFEARNTYKVYTYAAARGDSLALISLPWKNGEPQDIPIGIEYSPSLIYREDDITIEKYYPDYPQFLPE